MMDFDDEPISIHVVVEGEFLPVCYSPLGENPHANRLADEPFRDETVGIATVICKATDSAFLRCVDELEREKVVSECCSEMENAVAPTSPF